MALLRNQPIGDPRICARIEALTGHRGELSGQRKKEDGEAASDPAQDELPL